MSDEIVQNPTEDENVDQEKNTINTSGGISTKSSKIEATSSTKIKKSQSKLLENKDEDVGVKFEDAKRDDQQTQEGKQTKSKKANREKSEGKEKNKKKGKKHVEPECVQVESEERLKNHGDGDAEATPKEETEKKKKDKKQKKVHMEHLKDVQEIPKVESKPDQQLATKSSSKKLVEDADDTDKIDERPLKEEKKEKKKKTEKGKKKKLKAEGSQQETEMKVKSVPSVAKGESMRDIDITIKEASSGHLQGESSIRNHMKKKRSSSKSRKKSMDKTAFKSKSELTIDEEYSYGSSSSEMEIGMATKKTKKSKKDKKEGKARKQKKKKKGEEKSEEAIDLPKSDTQRTEASTTEKEETTPHKGKKRKAKKEVGMKGKKVKKKAEVQEPISEAEKESKEDDIMAEVMKMKMAVTEEKVDEPTTDTEVKVEKKGKKPKKAPKKKTKKDKTRVTAEMSEKMKQEMEQEAARLAEQERMRLEQERRAAIEKDKRETLEHQMRIEQLEKSDAEVQAIIEYNNEMNKKEMEEMEWQLYLACGKLPNPSLCDQMNTYLHLWEKDLDSTSIAEASQRTADVIKLLSDIEDLLDTSPLPNTPEEERKMENLKWVRQLFRDHQAESLDVATYRLLRCVEKNLHRIDIPTADFNFADDQIKLSLWLRVQLPIPLPNPRRPPKPRLDVNFDNISMQVLFPIVIDGENMAIRAMYLSYDHLSDLCQSHYIPQISEKIEQDLLNSTRKDWRNRQLYKYRNRDKPRQEPAIETISPTDVTVSEKKVEEDDGEEEFAEDEEIPLVPFKKLQPTASDYVAIQDEQMYQEIKMELVTNVEENVINLRKYSILGGLYHLDLLYQPPQPQDFITLNMNITALYLPKKLERVPFSVIYTPPKAPEPGVRRLPEEIEEEMKRQEEEMDKLVLITVTWQQHVIFLELPIVCQWNAEKQCWTKENVHDLKHNEEKGVLTFRTGIFGVFGLATLKYANLPYQAWELKPEADGTVTLQITAAILMLEFNIKDGLICISQLQNSPNNALQNMIGVYLKLFKLKRLMKEAGIDVFPDMDAFAYIEGSCEKHWPTVKHLYYDMARLCNSFNFAWSRWNMTAGRRNIVLQMREYFPNKTKQKNHSMLLVTPLRATFVDCTEVSQVFSADSMETFKFSSDLYNLMKVTSGIAVRKNVQKISNELVYALSDLLISTRILSFS